LTEATAAGVGEALAQARTSRGLALADVAKQLKFSPRHIEALEEERFESLPGATFARGMVRSYARLLKLDPEPLLERIADRFDAPDSGELAARFSQPVPFSDSGRRSTVLYLGLSVAVLAVVAFAAYQWRREGVEPEAVQVAAQSVPASPEASAVAPAPLPAVASAPSKPLPVAPAPSPAVAPAPSRPLPAAPVAAAPQAPSVAPPAREIAKDVTSSPAPVKVADAPKRIGSGRIVLRCEDESWIEVKDSAERTLISSLNAAGTERVVEGRPPFTLVIGNAQHVRVRYNDAPVDLGPHTKVEVARFTLQ
jgi:cytoskeleton protein RodZ